MVFIEFTRQEGGFFHFVGKTLEDVLEDTHNGESFGSSNLAAYRVVTYDEVKALGLRFFENGVEAISSNHTKSFMIGPPRK
ncbi:MAG: hypothetical protein AAB445_00185 [Patescibacteria group bacterium]